MTAPCVSRSMSKVCRPAPIPRFTFDEQALKYSQHPLIVFDEQGLTIVFSSHFLHTTHQVDTRITLIYIGFSSLLRNFNAARAQAEAPCSSNVITPSSTAHPALLIERDSGGLPGARHLAHRTCFGAPGRRMFAPCSSNVKTLLATAETGLATGIKVVQSLKDPVLPLDAPL